MRAHEEVRAVRESLAGVIGSTIAAITMEKAHPRWSFLIFGTFSLYVGISCIFLSSDAEKEFIRGDEPVVSEWSSEIRDGQTPSEALKEREEFERTRPAYGEEGFWYNFKRNMRNIGWSITHPEIYLIVIFFLIDGLTNPNF